MAAQGRYRELRVWQEAMELVERIYRLTAGFPRDERWGLTSQLRRAATSVPLNIAEGSCRGARRDYARFVSLAMGSLGEIETGLEIAVRLGYLPPAAADELAEPLSRLGRMLRALRSRLTTEPGESP